MKRLALFTLVVLLTLSGLALAWQLRSVIIIFLLSLAVAAALRPLVDQVAGRGLPRGLALAVVYGATLALAAGAIWLAAPLLAAELRTASDHFVATYDQIWASWPRGTEFQRTVAAWLPAPEDLYAAVAGPPGEALLQGALGLTASVLAVAGQASIVIILSLYWGIDQAHFERLWLAVLPAPARARAREIGRAIETGTGAYIRSEVIQSLLAAVALGLGYWMLGIPYPGLMGLIAAVAWLVPWLGAALGLLPVVVFGWAAGVVPVGLAALFTIVVYLLLELVVEPRIHTRDAYSPLLIVLVMLGLGDAYGLLGVLVAPPLAAAMQILFTNLFAAKAGQAEPAAAVAGGGLERLEDRLRAVRTALAAAPEPASPQVASLVDRLDGLIGEAALALEAEPEATTRPRRGGRVREH